MKAPILPWLRSIDGMNTHDESYQLAMAGGVTTAQILPGSANNIGTSKNSLYAFFLTSLTRDCCHWQLYCAFSGGQAFVIKLRPTSERSATSKVIEPPWTLTHNDSDVGEGGYVRWRHMKYVYAHFLGP